MLIDTLSSIPASHGLLPVETQLYTLVSFHVSLSFSFSGFRSLFDRYSCSPGFIPFWPQLPAFLDTVAEVELQVAAKTDSDLLHGSPLF